MEQKVVANFKVDKLSRYIIQTNKCTTYIVYKLHFTYRKYLRYLKYYIYIYIYIYIYASCKSEKNEMGGACGAYGGGERCAQGSVGET